MAYTIEVREKGKAQPFQFIGTDGKVHRTARKCKPLTKEDAKLARQLLMESAAKAGRPIDCRIVDLATLQPANMEKE